MGVVKRDSCNLDKKIGSKLELQYCGQHIISVYGQFNNLLSTKIVILYVMLKSSSFSRVGARLWNRLSQACLKTDQFTKSNFKK